MKKTNRFILPLLASLVVYAFAWLVADLPPSPLRFTDEKIEMDVTSESCAIDGWYKFRNKSPFPRRTRFFYPFPINGADYPDFMEASVLHDSAETPLKFKKLSDGISFHLKVPGNGETQFIIRYKQNLHGKRAKYIVTTTKSWRRPLDHAVFQVCHPAELENARYTYPGKKIKSDDNAVCRLIEWRHHMPDKDIEVRWRN